MASLGIRALNKVLNELRTSYYTRYRGLGSSDSRLHTIGAGAQGQECMPPPRKVSSTAARNFVVFTVIGFAILIFILICAVLDIPVRGSR